MILEFGEADRAHQLSHIAHVDGQPARFLALAGRVVVVAAPVELSRIGKRRAGHFGDADHPRLGTVGVVEQDAVADLHAVAHEVARLVVADTGPGFDLDLGQVVDRKLFWLALDQPVTLAHDFPAAVGSLLINPYRLVIASPWNFVMANTSGPNRSYFNPLRPFILASFEMNSKTGVRSRCGRQSAPPADPDAREACAGRPERPACEPPRSVLGAAVLR